MPAGRQTGGSQAVGGGREFRLAYHGGTEAVPSPEIRERLHAPDFGKGFYTAESEEQAVRWARRVRFVRKAAEAVVTAYDVSAIGGGGLAVKVFDGVSEEWFDAAIACRAGHDVLGRIRCRGRPRRRRQCLPDLALFRNGRLFQGGSDAAPALGTAFQPGRFQDACVAPGPALCAARGGGGGRGAS